MTATAAKSTGWVLIIGASSAIGRALADRYAADGDSVLLIGRDREDLSRLAADLRIRHDVRAEVIELDVLDFDRHATFWSECLAHAGDDLRGIICVHSVMPPQAEAQADPATLRRVIDTNFTATASLLSLAAAEMETRGRGFLCAVSSVAGDRGRQSNYVYGSSKAAVSVFLQGLRNRLFRSGVTVTDVKPGFVDTAMTWGLPGLFLVATPARVAADVHRAIRAGRAEVYSPWFWRWIMLIIRSIPDFVFKRMRL